MPDSHNMRSDVLSRSWDYSLTVVTVVLLGGLGLQSFIGTLYTWWAQRTIPGWEQTSYLGYVDVMNAIAAPQLILLVIVMGLCVPKRLFSRQTLVIVSVAMVAVGGGVALATSSLTQGLAVYLVLAALIQVAVVVLTVAGTRAPSYITEGRLTKTGSGLLHLGFILFALCVVALQQSPYMMPVFWAASITTMVGTTLSFYAKKFAGRDNPTMPESPHTSGEDAEGMSTDTDDASAETG